MLASKVKFLTGIKVTTTVNIQVNMVAIRLEITTFTDKLSVPIARKILWFRDFFHALDHWALAFSITILEVLKYIFLSLT
jgi:hypothetical protein